MRAEVVREKLVRVQPEAQESYHPGKRLKQLILSVALVAIGAISATIIGPAFLQKGLNFWTGAASFLFIVPGTALFVAGGSKIAEAAMGGKNFISKIVDSLTAEI